MPNLRNEEYYQEREDLVNANQHEDNVWEDVSEIPKMKEELQEQNVNRGTPGPARSNVLPRKRRPNKATNLSGKNNAKNKRARPVISAEELIVHGWNGIVFVISYTFDVFKTAIHLLRKPFSFLLLLWFLALILGQAPHFLRAALAPLCSLPLVSWTSLCSPKRLIADQRPKPRWADYPKLIDVQSKSFEELLEESAGGSGLSLEIKQAEMATSDLVTLVRMSDLKSKEMLGDSLVAFVEDARRAGEGLQRLNAKIGGAVDNIMAVNDYALHAIEEANDKASSLFSLQALIPWSSSKTTRIVTETFTEAMDVLSENMQRLIIEAEINRVYLNELEEHLLTLHEIVSREDSSLSVEKTALLENLWTRLGANQDLLRGHNRDLLLLKKLGEYRRQALLHVVAALHTLRSMSADMEDLRERVTAPGLVSSKIPVEVHIKSIRSGLERLKEGRIRAKALGENARRKFLEIPTDESEEAR